MENPSEKAWKSDPRLHKIGEEKRALLLAFANELASVPGQQKMTAFFMKKKELISRGIAFSPEEQDLLFEVLMEQMTPEERRKAEMLRNMFLGSSGTQTSPHHEPL